MLIAVIDFHCNASNRLLLKIIKYTESRKESTYY